MEYEEVNVTINLTFYLLTMTHLYLSLKLLLMFYIKEMKRGKFRKQKIFRTVLLVRAVCKNFTELANYMPNCTCNCDDANKFLQRNRFGHCFQVMSPVF